MTFLPIVDRELRVAARLTATYRNRSIIAGVVTFVAMVMFALGAFSTSPSHVGSSMFWTLAYMALAFCLLEGVRKTADCLCEEKREGTLGLLFLTDLKGYDIVLGKLAAKSLSSIYGLLSVLPVLALSLLLGGITAGEYWRIVLALANILFFSLCAGMWVSCWSRDERQAMTASFMLVALWVAVPLLIGWHSLYPLSPVYAFEAGAARAYLFAPGDYWQSLGIAQGLSWAMLLWASLAVPHCWREEKFNALSAQWWRRSPKMRPHDALRRARRRAQMLDINPAYWLAGRNPSQRIMLAVAI
ncbi:MAG: family transporter protein, partial [Pedosphaera sp.]|nr:family transporter protein [Pedosphaera sp.]